MPRSTGEFNSHAATSHTEYAPVAKSAEYGEPVLLCCFGLCSLETEKLLKSSKLLLADELYFYEPKRIAELPQVMQSYKASLSTMAANLAILKLMSLNSKKHPFQSSFILFLVIIAALASAAKMSIQS